MHQRLTNSSAKPASGPECSVPATGCAGMKSTVAGRCAAMSRSTAVFTEPTSETIAPALSCAAISFATGPQAPTGTQAMTRSASFDRLARWSRRSGAQGRVRSRARARRPTRRWRRSRRQGLSASAPRAIDEPISPRPMMRNARKNERRCVHFSSPENRASAATTSRLASSVPTVRRSACGSL